MKANNFFFGLVLFIGLSTLNVSALTPKETSLKKSRKELCKEIKRTLVGPSFDYLETNCCEIITLKCIVDENGQLKVHRVLGENQKLIEYVKETLGEEKIIADARMQGKMLVYKIDFLHRKL
jgi:hypothetical protein